MGQEQRDREFQALLQDARTGDADAQFKLGLAYEYGEFDEYSLAEAFHWIKKAAQQGHGHAQVKLSDYYERGVSGAPDFTAAYLWAEKAAVQGIVAAQKRLSVFLSLGKGADRDFEKAAYWEKEFLTREAADGEASSMYHLGRFYREGRAGYPKDPKEAMKWYTESAELGYGYTTAMLTLAGIYEKGIEWPRDEQKALQLYERAGKEGVKSGPDPLFYAGTSTKMLSLDSSREDSSPQIDNGKVVWSGRTSGGQNEIYLYNSNDGTSTQLTNNAYEDRDPQIDGGLIVWEGYDGYDNEIFLYDGATIIQPVILCRLQMATLRRP